MSRRPETVMIPARLTVTDLSTAIHKSVDAVIAAALLNGETSGPEDVLSADVAVEIAQALGVNARVEPRDIVLEVLYQYETVGIIGEVADTRAKALVEGVVSSIDELDRLIEEASDHWSVSRMPVIDRNILRLALYELQSNPGTATPVVLSEAVRLARLYSTEKSGSFVNGVVAALAKQVRPPMS